MKHNEKETLVDDYFRKSGISWAELGVIADKMVKDLFGRRFDPTFFSPQKMICTIKKSVDCADKRW